MGQTRATRRWSVATAWLFAAIAGAAGAAPTDLDWRWDADGMLFPPLSPGGYVKQIRLQDGASLLLAATGTEPYIARFDTFGGRDGAFGAAGAIGPPPGLWWTPALEGVTLLQDGRLNVQWYHLMLLAPRVWECLHARARYYPTGQPDRSFGLDGVANWWEGGSRTCGLAEETDTADNWYRIDARGLPYEPDTHTSTISVFAADGTRRPDLTPFDTSKWWYVGLTIDAQDRLLVSLSSRDGDGGGFHVGRTGTGTFGTGGIASLGLPGSPWPYGVRPLDGGGVLAYGLIGDIDATGARQAVIVRFTEDGRPDRRFGEGGAVVIAFARAGDRGVTRVGVAAMRDGRLLVVAEVDGRIDAYRSFIHLRMARLMADGTRDTSFAENGIATIQTEGETLLRDGPLLRPSGEFLVASSNVVYQFRGGDLAVPYPPVQRAAVEYVHAGHGHYFVTADVLEIATLDASPASGWARTGKAFNVYGSGDPLLVPVCRFWSGQSYAPKSSHFYTPYVDECAKVKQDPAWRFERNAFYVRMPEGVSGARTCPSGTQPLYRAYNNEKSGAPNHRYTTDPAVLDAVIAQGWTMEGEAATRVFACVPLQD